ncbi:MAG: AarF/UbiB family protein [Candidatus Heimdallarchaeota archaeon]|nr:AarF/UbiB family protein [Candidatus Heimdallarchaeota archaeon]
MSLKGASALKLLNKHEIRILVAIEVGMKTSQFIDIETIAKYSGYNQGKIEHWLKNCHKLNLVHRWSGHFTGYELTIHGYDLLALNALYEKGVIKSIGRERGVGKESRIFYALNNNDQEVLLKLHRVGFTSFHQVKKKRRYTANKHHISELYSSRLSAESEVKWLKIANEMNLPVPTYFDYNRHIIVMELIEGIDLVKVKNLDEPVEILENIVLFIKNAWSKANFVHGDLSEYNILLKSENLHPIIIDFPQSVDRSEKNANELLMRDIKNIISFFDRKYKLNTDINEIYNYVTN